MAKKRTFVKCGKKAFGFADPFSKFNVTRGEVKELTTTQQLKSGKIKNALRGGHLEFATEEEFNAFNKKVEDLKSGKKPEDEKPEKTKKELFRETLEDKTKAQLVEYYGENYQVTDEEVEAFSKLKHGEMVEELLSLDD